ncbi:Protein ENHANCED DISEASE RESISTANCE 4 [Hirschfeldia incana]|nr:Protein ENHANCED DISEASE RESISTANCE 4 [Hirschfeldia incana]
MASKSGQRVRLVKCPKCFKILQEDEDVPVYQCGGCSTILQAKRRTIVPNITPSEGGADAAQANEPKSEPEANNVSSSSEQDTVLPPPTGRSSVKIDEKAPDGSLESTEKQLGGSIGEEANENQLQERSPGDSDKTEREDKSSRLKSDLKPMAETMRPGTSSGSLNADHVVDTRTSDSSSDAYRKLQAEISPDSSPVEEEQQNEDDYFFNRHRESTDDHPANKTCSTYDESQSSSDEREDELLTENDQWKALQEISSGKFQMQRFPENLKEQRRGSSSSTTFSEKSPHVTATTTYMERYQNRSLQLEGPGGRLGRQGRRHVTEQLRPNIPFHPREPYTRVSPSYPSQDEFDRYSHAHSVQMPPYESVVDHMYHNNTRARGRGQGSRFSGEMTNGRRRNHPGWYSGQLQSSYGSYYSSPQRPMEQQPAYYPRWSHEIVSDAEDHQRNRHANLQARHRQAVAKRHIRPTAGGAPFVSCYRCSANLQLPVDFLIFKRKYHLLRCGRCTTVLKFSLQSRTHLVPAVKRDIDANRSSNSTSESLRDKAPSKQPEKASSSAQEEEIPVARGSPLHRLMGYSTVSQVFKASQRPPSL